MKHDYAIVCGVVMVLGIVLGSAAWFEREPRYSVGACLQLEEREPWDVHQIYRIEMVGRKHYLVRKAPVHLLRPTDGVELSFQTAREYQRVVCPQKGH